MQVRINLFHTNLESDSKFVWNVSYICKMIIRTAEAKALQLASKFKALAIIGPRQSGKTTLAKKLFKGKPYTSLENPDIRAFAEQDPRRFLAQYPDGAILDEVQRVPHLFSYLQEILDDSKKRGQFILTGSNNFTLQESISQTLAGRMGFLNLLPLCFKELATTRYKTFDENKYMLHGGYPAVYDEKHIPIDWYGSYLRTYVERDVRQLKNIGLLYSFERFMRLCAARTGQELNMSDLANEAGVDVKTIQSWISILENSYIIFLLRPHFKNFSKRLVKRPKLYFYDTGLACFLLGIQNHKELEINSHRGQLFETMVIGEMIKQRYNAGTPMNLYFWRDNAGHEVDVIIDRAGKLFPIELKSSHTASDKYLDGIRYWNELSNTNEGAVVYAGKLEHEPIKGFRFINWKNIDL